MLINCFKYKSLELVITLNFVIFFSCSFGISDNFQVKNSELDTLVLSFNIGEYQIIQQGNFHNIKTPVPNHLDFPIYTTYIQVQNNQQYNATIKPISNKEYNNIFLESSNMINNNDLDNLIISEPLIMRGNIVQKLTFSPFHYNNENKMLVVSDKVDIKLSMKGSSTIKNSREIKGSYAFDPLFKNIIENYDRPSSFQEPAILYICGGDISSTEAFQNLIDWRHRNGFITYTANISEIGNSTTSVKNYIQNAYDNFNPAPEYVTIIGDEGGQYDVPTFTENSSACNSWWDGGDWGDPSYGDHLYTLLEGDDEMPEVLIGRISIRNSSQFSVIASKIIQYELAIDMENNWYEKAALCSDPYTDSGLSPVITNESIEYIMETAGMEDVRTNYGSGSLSSWMRSQIDEGILYLNYRGFGGVSDFSENDINNANNGYKLPFFTILTCYTGMFNDESSNLSEYILRAGSTNSPRGGIGAIGMSGATHTLFNNIAAMGFYHGLFVDNVQTAGAVLYSGKHALFNTYIGMENNQECDWYHYYTHLMNLMGDSATPLWTDTPNQFIIEHHESIQYGTNAIEFYITNHNGDPVEEARITLLKSDNSIDEIFLSVYTDENGYGLAELEYESIGNIDITVSKYNYKPNLSTINILDNLNEVINISAPIVVNDNDNNQWNPGEEISLSIPIINNGISQTNELQVSLYSSNHNVSNNTGTLLIDNLGPNESSTINFDLSLDQFDLNIDSLDPIFMIIEITNENNINWTYTFPIPIYAPWLTLDDIVFISGDGSPGNDLIFDIFIKNSGNITMASTGTILEYIGNSEINISTPVLIFDNIESGDVNSSSNPIQIYIGENTIKGSNLNFNLSISENNFFSDTSIPISFNAGDAESNDPLGPDLYGYYIYDISDSSYSLVPNYGWIEINPNLGGQGTQLDIVDWGNGEPDAQQSAVIDLPFPINFYGEEYSAITISSNGWVSLGESNLESFRNTPIPGPGGPSPMIAVFWDDLTTENGDIFYYFQEDGDYLVIEWSKLETYQYQDLESFQLVIYNNVLPSPTGDNDMLFQYKIFNNTTNGNYPGYVFGDFIHGAYSTIGLENHLASDGLQYSFNNLYPESATPLHDETALFITTRLPYNLISSDTTIGAPPLTVNFSEVSDYNVNYWEWDLNGDGAMDAFTQDVEYTYNDFGTYTVYLRVNNGENQFSDIRRNFIQILKYGCMDINANNYDDSAQVDDGSCEYIHGCTDLFAMNYNPNAYIDDGSCFYIENNFSAYFQPIDQSLGTGEIRFTIADSMELINSSLNWLRFEINASQSNTFEAYKMDDPKLYVYPIVNNANPLATSYLQFNINELSNIEIDSLLDLPGAISENQIISIPNYILENHSILYLDDDNYYDNWTNLIEGVYFRADNILGSYSTDIFAEIEEVYSTTNPNLIYKLDIALDYYNSSAFYKRPIYDYKIQFSSNILDTAFTVSPSSGCSDLPVNTLLPFKIINLHTNKQVGLYHSDKGIYNSGTTSNQDPGYRDCVWERNEGLFFYKDTVATTNETEPDDDKTFKLYIDFDINNISNNYTEWLTNQDYNEGTIVKFEEMLWQATTNITNNIEPNIWIDSDNNNFNDNPWQILYPWEDGDEIIIKPWKWYVDGDSYITSLNNLLTAFNPLYQESNNLPNDFMLNNIYPNPFNTSTKINYYIPYSSKIQLNIYDILGKEIQNLYNGQNSQGFHTIDWNADNLSSGLYIVQMKTNNKVLNKKVMLIK